MTMHAEAVAGRVANLNVAVASGDALDIRQFTVSTRMSALFSVTLVVASDNHDIDFEAVVGQPARFSAHGGFAGAGLTRTWTGVCNWFQQVGTEERGLSIYHLTIVPSLWLSTQRRNHRMFQHMSEIDIVLKLLGEWGIEPEKRLTAAYKKRKYRVQYGESDYAFMCRMLEDAGISFYFEQDGDETKMVLSDAPQANEPRAASIPFKDHPTVADREHVTAVKIGRQVKPGRYTMQDHDHRKDPKYKLMTTAAASTGAVEETLERYHYTPGAFLFQGDKGESTPHADDRGKHRPDEGEAAILARKRLDAKRGAAKICAFDTNVLDVAPGVVMSMLGHPRSDLGDDKKLLIVEASLSGTFDGEWTQRCEAQSADVPYYPPLRTPKPKVSGVESATVVGPPGEEIYCDEFGRVRVHFHWDRESAMDDRSSCWMHVSHPWGGAGFGGINLPRVGQEVIVDFLGGDPDQPIIIGRVYTNLQKVPFKLPENKSQSGWKSSSTGGGGGYNEIMFEDASGKELLRMQAEKDLNKLVKNDESAQIGNNRTKSIGNDDGISVGNNRSSMVGSNNSEVIGGNESVAVGGNQGVTVGGNQSVTVTGNQGVMVTGSQTESVLGSRGVATSGNDTLNVAGAQDVTVDGAQTTTLKSTHVIDVTSHQEIKVGGEQGIKVTGPQLLSSEAMQTLKAPVQQIEAEANQTMKSTFLSVEASALATIQTMVLNLISSGSTSIRAGQLVIFSGPISITGGDISISGGRVSISGSPVDVNGGAQVNVTGAVIKLN